MVNLWFLTLEMAVYMCQYVVQLTQKSVLIYLMKLPPFLTNYTYVINDSWNQNDQLNIRLTIEGYENNFILEEFLDSIREKEKKVRFAIECFQPNKQYPSLIRINRQFKKIRVQNKKR